MNFYLNLVIFNKELIKINNLFGIQKFSFMKIVNLIYQNGLILLINLI